MTEEETMDAGALPLTADEERLLRFARSINGAPVDYPPVVAVDRLLATLDAIRAAARRELDPSRWYLVMDALDRLDVIAQEKRDTAKRTAISTEDWQWSNGFTAAVKEIRRELAFAAAREPVAPAESEPLGEEALAAEYERGWQDANRLAARGAALAQPPAPVSAEAARVIAFLRGLVLSGGQLSNSDVEYVEAAIRGTTAGTPLDVDDILPQLPDDASLSRQFRAGWYAARQALATALRGQPSETPSEPDRA